jgi:hypothetical protein
MAPAIATATPQQLTAQPSSVRFGSILVGQSDTLPVTVTNSGSTSVTISGISSVPTAFQVTSLSLPLTLAAGASVSFNVTFTPSSKGYDGEAISFTTTSSNKTFYVKVAGVGVTSESLTTNPASLSFGNVSVGASSTLPVVLTNSGTTTIVITQDQLTGTGFAVSGLSLPVTLTPNQSLTVSVTFAPQTVGAVSGALVSPNGGLALLLAGTGTSLAGQLVLAPASLNFGNVTVGTTGTQSVTLSASGGSVTISSAASSSSQFALEGASFPVTVAAGQNVSYNVGFTPKSSGTTSGSLSFASNASNSQTLESMTGVGLVQQYSVDLAWTPSTSQVAGYNVYRGTSSQGPYSKINSALDPSTAYTDSTVTSGQTYYYAATAVDSSGDESAYSTPITATIP